jgi:hypothetical protein
LLKGSNDSGCTKYDLSSKAGYNIGYYTNIFAGVGFRLGRVCSKFYEWEANPNSHYASVFGAELASEPSADPSKSRDHFVFFSYQARLIGYNALLQGQIRDSVVTLSGSEIGRFVNEASAGWVYQMKSLSSLTYALHLRSSEIKGPYSRSHWYGSFVYTRAF